MIKGLCGFMEESSSLYIPTLQKFGSYRHCGSRDIMTVVCHVISQDQLIQGSCHFMVVPTDGSHTTAKLDGHTHHCNRDIMGSVCHVISPNHLTKRYSNIMGRSPCRLVIILSSLVAIGTVVVDICS